MLGAFGDRAAFEDTLTEALDTLFGGDSGATGGDDQVEPTDPADEGTQDPDQGETPTEPQQALLDRDAALKAGDLEAFAVADKRLTAAVEKLLALDTAAGQ